MNKEYNMAVALLQFKKAFTTLVNCSEAMPDLDLSENYPFYLLDFEQIEGTVEQWCMIHASKLMSQVPDKVVNPACLECTHFKERTPVKCSKEFNCINYPEIPFSKLAVSGALYRYCDINPITGTEAEALTAYLKLTAHFGENPS